MLSEKEIKEIADSAYERFVPPGNVPAKTKLFQVELAKVACDITIEERERAKVREIEVRMEENNSLYEYAKLHMDSWAILVIGERIRSLQQTLSTYNAKS